MKTKKKRTRTKAKIKALKKINDAAFLSLVLIIVIFSAYLTYTNLSQPQDQTKNPTSPQPKAVIIDQLSLTFPNQTFVETVTNTLKQVGYKVDYYPGENVIVDFYRNLPTHGYSLIILRAHSTATGPAYSEGPVALFTSEHYSQTKYIYEQLTEQLVTVSFSQEEREKGIGYFGIRPNFVMQSMKGRFQNTIIIMMGCEGLDNSLMAQAFVQKGARVYIGWYKPVSASHTDTAIIHLLQHFLMEKATLKESVRQTFREIGFDPMYNSLLIYYPLEAGEETIENTNSQN
jgi:hypothetical protein